MRLIFALPLLLIASPALAQVRIVPDQPADAAAAKRGVDVFVMNEGEAPATADLPDTLSITAKDGTSLLLSRIGDAQRTISPGGFAKSHYRSVNADALATAAGDTRADDVKASPGDGLASAGSAPSAPPTRDTEVTLANASGSHAGFLNRFEPYEPIYGVFGAGSAGAKLQFSFAFRPFSHAGALNGVRFAYTQTMLWALDQPSGPFRSTDYSPELFYQMPVGKRITAAVGWRHTSNGKGPAGSIDANRIYARAGFDIPLGQGWRAEVTPQAWFFVGTKGTAPDLDRYWGYSALGLSVEQANGIKLAGTLRGNPGTGKGAGELFISYPLVRVGGLGFYLFGQGFTGYGESLSDYNRKVTYGRIGISLTR